MATETFHVRKVSVGLTRRYRISADDGSGRPGDLLAYAEKQLTVADRFTVWRDDDRGQPLASVAESKDGWLAALIGYEVLDAGGTRLGSFGVVWKRSFARTTCQLEQPEWGRAEGVERSVSTARVRRLFGVAAVAGQVAAELVKYHFDFTRDGGPVLSVEKVKVLDDWYRLVVHDDRLDRRLLFALAIAMEARQRP